MRLLYLLGKKLLLPLHVLRWLLARPMLLVAVGIHLLVLRATLPSEPQPEFVEIPPPEPVEITSLTAIEEPIEETEETEPEEEELEVEEEPEPEERPRRRRREEEPEPEPEPRREPEEREPEPEEEDDDDSEEEEYEEEDDYEEEDYNDEDEDEETDDAKDLKEEEPGEGEGDEEEPEEEEPEEEEPQEEDPEEDEEEDDRQQGEQGAALVEQLYNNVFFHLTRPRREDGVRVNDPARTEIYMRELDVEGVDNDVPKEQFFDGNALRSEAIAHLSIPQASPRAAYQDYIERSLDELNFETERLDEEFGGQRLYRAENPGGVEFYMSLIPLKLNSGSILIIWKDDPRTF